MEIMFNVTAEEGIAEIYMSSSAVFYFSDT